MQPLGIVDMTSGIDATVLPMTDTLNSRAAANIRAEMARHRVSQEDLATAAGLSRPALSDLLGEKTQITLAKLDAIATALEVEPAKLLND